MFLFCLLLFLRLDMSLFWVQSKEQSHCLLKFIKWEPHIEPWSNVGILNTWNNYPQFSLVPALEWKPVKLGFPSQGFSRELSCDSHCNTSASGMAEAKCGIPGMVCTADGVSTTFPVTTWAASTLTGGWTSPSSVHAIITRHSHPSAFYGLLKATLLAPLSCLFEKKKQLLQWRRKREHRSAGSLMHWFAPKYLQWLGCSWAKLGLNQVLLQR